jgi:hypothetical protein
VTAVLSRRAFRAGRTILAVTSGRAVDSVSTGMSYFPALPTFPSFTGWPLWTKTALTGNAWSSVLAVLAVVTWSPAFAGLALESSIAPIAFRTRRAWRAMQDLSRLDRLERETGGTDRH